MPVIEFQNADGASRRIEAAKGMSVMQAAVAAGVEEIVAECGGQMACATCHVYVKSQEQFDRLPPRSEAEEDMLDFTSEPRRATSRLSCQLRIDETLDGLVLELPRTQI